MSAASEYLMIVPSSDETITITAAAQTVAPPNGHPTLRVDAVISAGARAGQPIHREYVLDPNSIPARRALGALVSATGIQLDAHGGFAAAALIGQAVADAPKLGAWLSQPITDDDHVRAKLDRNDKGSVRSSGANVELILRESSELAGRLRYDMLARRVEVVDGVFASTAANDLPVAVANWLDAEWDVRCSSHVVGEQLLYVARRYGSYDPLVEYLNGLTWDGVPRIDTWLTVYLGVARSPYVDTVGAKWLISGAARGLTPGSKVDTMLIIEGHQGLGKSSVIRTLGGHWSSDTPIDVGDKDSRIAASRSWIVELAELSSLRRASIEALKAYLSASRDRLRPPYGRVEEDYLRRCIYAGTTNDHEYLVDETGNRRFWVVIAGAIDLDALGRDRDQLWAEAVVRYRAGERWWLDAEQQQAADDVTEQHKVPSPWADLVGAYVDRQSPDRTYTLHEIALAALGIGRADLDARKASITAALRAAGMRQVGREDRPGEGRVRVWRRP